MTYHSKLQKRSYLDVVILCVCLGIHLLQEKTKSCLRSYFKCLWEMCAETAAIQRLHCLLPADRFTQLIDKLMPDAVCSAILP